MKEILKLIAWLFIMLGCLIIQLIALVFASIGLVFNTLTDVLCNISQSALKKCPATKEEEKPSEEVPT